MAQTSVLTCTWIEFYFRGVNHHATAEPPLGGHTVRTVRVPRRIAITFVCGGGLSAARAVPAPVSALARAPGPQPRRFAVGQRAVRAILFWHSAQTP